MCATSVKSPMHEAQDPKCCHCDFCSSFQNMARYCTYVCAFHCHLSNRGSMPEVHLCPLQYCSQVYQLPLPQSLLTSHMFVHGSPQLDQLCCRYLIACQCVHHMLSYLHMIFFIWSLVIVMCIQVGMSLSKMSAHLFIISATGVACSPAHCDGASMVSAPVAAILAHTPPVCVLLLQLCCTCLNAAACSHSS